MAHADYNCCALCDCKMAYVESDNATTKEEICMRCLRALHDAGVIVHTGGELEEWIKSNPDMVDMLPVMGYTPCFYDNPVDDAFQAAMPAA